MHQNLQKNIKNRISSKKISVCEFERRAGLKPCSVKNILNGRSKNPTLEILVPLAKELHCSIEDLLIEYTNNIEDNKIQEASKQTLTWSSPLYIEALSFVVSFLAKNNIITTFATVQSCLAELYAYSVSLSKETLDKQFAVWLTKRYWLNA